MLIESANVKFVFEDRMADSPFVELIWRTQSEEACTFMSAAVSQWEMVVAHHQGETHITLRGPETEAIPAACPAGTEFFGIQFKLGTFIPHLPLGKLVNGSLDFPAAAFKSFWLHGAPMQIPNYENVEHFVQRLVRDELLVYEPIVDAVLQNQVPELSLRSVQRRFVRATGLTHGTIHQIGRARQAAALLAQGVSILDTVEQAGYADQPHLTRALKRFMGQTPAQILRENGFA
jgi:AraC-like DNA-binding protein